ncbi:GNAT family N-acetyltransferase [Nonlabens ponticola]|uniref:GNAT family N-acetyltransferase n=1 Tax=Nonlabens ponticola TaxID=2496866 RepID=A0A3S9MUN6_9FLAO|nr:GNAT family N-acetyltransferase [Nonlabens ponticola]AZQ42863.1 GNAT family N-acetyltransferase [Nonlabens ponticola]
MTIKEIEAIETYSVRHPVLRTGRPVETCKMDGDDLESTIHLGAYDGDLLVGVTTLLLDSIAELDYLNHSKEKTYRMRGMGVLANQQGNGIGRKIVEHAENLLRDNGIKLLWFNARIVAIPFYLKLGFIKYGNQFDVPNVGPHYNMYKEL